MRTEALPLLLPHRMTVQVLVTYPSSAVADYVEQELRARIDRKGPRWELEPIADRPAMTERRSTLDLTRVMEEVAKEWEIPLKRETSVWPSVAGPAPSATCGIGPVARDLGTPNESAQRISPAQRTRLLAEFLHRPLD